MNRILCEDIKRGSAFYYTRIAGQHDITASKAQAYSFENCADAESQARQLRQSAGFTGLRLTVQSPWL